MSDRDGDFSQPTKDLLARKAGHICSNPFCSAPTSGATLTDATRAVNQGKAAHIIAAADNGPRGDPSIVEDARRDESNGIWLCAACADLVDKNSGADYPKATLRKWKAEREATSAREVGRPGAQMTVVDGAFEAHGITNVTGLDVQGPARLQPGTRVVATGVAGVTGARIGSGSPPVAAQTQARPGRVGAAFGVTCRKCGVRIEAYGSGDGNLSCPDCGGALVADPDATLVALANVSCPCGWSAGLAAGTTSCPSCGRRL